MVAAAPEASSVDEWWRWAAWGPDRWDERRAAWWFDRRDDRWAAWRPWEFTCPGVNSLLPGLLNVRVGGTTDTGSIGIFGPYEALVANTANNFQTLAISKELVTLEFSLFAADSFSARPARCLRADIGAIINAQPRLLRLRLNSGLTDSAQGAAVPNPTRSMDLQTIA